MALVEKDLSAYLVSTLCYVLGHQPPEQAAQNRKYITQKYYPTCPKKQPHKKLLEGK